MLVVEDTTAGNKVVGLPLRATTKPRHRLGFSPLCLPDFAPHSTELLAAIAHFSPYHFHRLYRAMTGESVAVTVRRARLARAAYHLVEGTASVIDAAAEAGYDNAQSFARAFREMTGLSPSTFQARQQAIGTDLSVRLVERAATTVYCCVRHDGPLATIPHTYRRLYQTCQDARAGLHCGRRQPPRQQRTGAVDGRGFSVVVGACDRLERGPGCRAGRPVVRFARGHGTHRCVGLFPWRLHGSGVG
ncbi:helix-turn-helix domain-containing protein [Chitinimonas arctica]|uniref:helix-turn-helix domain-containing protein n=1 Tax=Chitinimonas arctica TaxID=2594795 RepID=UPI001CC46685